MCVGDFFMTPFTNKVAAQAYAAKHVEGFASLLIMDADGRIEAFLYFDSKLVHDVVADAARTKVEPTYEIFNEIFDGIFEN
jgi:hypothetical protein